MDGSNPVTGAKVTLSTGVDGEINNVEATSNEQGDVTFKSVVVGGNIIKVEKEGYLPISGIINFKFEEGYNYQVIEGSVAPIKRNESAIIPFYSIKNSTTMATIKGKVSIQTDLTTKAKEVPVGTIIKADFSENVLMTSEGMKFQQYTLSTESGEYGKGVVKEDGTYEIKVPTSMNGNNVKLIIPQVRLEQKLAINGREDDQDESGPELAKVYADYGYGINYDNFPSVYGVKFAVNEPEKEGEGFQIKDVKPVGRPICLSNDWYSKRIDEGYNTENQMIYYCDFGKNYKTTPKLTLTDPTGKEFQANINMKYAIQEIKVTKEGKYNPNSYVSFTVFMKRRGQNGNFEYYNDDYLKSDSDGKITQKTINDKVNSLINNGNYGWGYSSMDIGFEFDDIYVEFGKSTISGGITAEATIEKIESNIYSIRVTNVGKNYTNPVAKFEGGTPEVPAVLEIKNFATQWKFTLDNDKINAPYSLIPNISFDYINIDNNWNTTSNVSNASSGSIYSISNILGVKDGKVVYTIPNADDIATSFYSYEKPNVLIKNSTHSKPKIRPILNNEGGLESLRVDSYGRGYKEKFDIKILPVVEGISGSGAEVAVLHGSYSNGEYIWEGDYKIVNSGKGYLNNVNVAEFERLSVSGSTNFKIYPEDIVYLDIDYSTGKRSEGLK